MKLLTCAEVENDGGFDFGMDEVTPVTFTFRSRSTKRAYRSFVLPRSLENPAAQQWMREHQRCIMSLRELRAALNQLQA